MHFVQPYRPFYPEQIEHQQYLSNQFGVDFAKIVIACNVALQEPQELPIDLKIRISAFVRQYIRHLAFNHDELILDKIRYNPKIKACLIDALTFIFDQQASKRNNPSNIDAAGI